MERIDSGYLLLQLDKNPEASLVYVTRTIDELLGRDALREKDGLPRKIRMGRLVKPGKGGKEKIILVPTTVEERFIHDMSSPRKNEDGGSGEGKEGEVIGEEPIHVVDEGQGGAGQGDGGEHEIESSAYELGRILGDKFQLPNLKDKGRKRSLNRYKFDLTDRNIGTGQLLDKKATIRRIVETNISLGNISGQKPIDPGKLLVAPRDKVYRIVSREKEYESQAMVFFLRDYSGSMIGKPTEIVVSQHVLLYSWLLYQYERRVETRFILHDTEAKEVPDFYTYYNSAVAGGTRVKSAYQLVNKIVREENLARDYNIYVFHGTDGDDWDSDGENTVPELEEILTYTNRMGLTIVTKSQDGYSGTAVEGYVRDSGLLESKPDLIRLDSIGEDAPETRLIEGIKKLLS